MATQLNTKVAENINAFLNSLVEDVEKALIMITGDSLQVNPS